MLESDPHVISVLEIVARRCAGWAAKVEAGRRVDVYSYGHLACNRFESKGWSMEGSPCGGGFSVRVGSEYIRDRSTAVRLGVVTAMGSGVRDRLTVSGTSLASRIGMPAMSRSWPTRTSMWLRRNAAPMHHDNAILALRAFKHVLVEKPFTMNAVEAREVVRVARENGRFAMEAMWTRFLPHVVVIRDWLARGALGEVVTVTADHGQWFAEDPEFRLFAPELGGGALLDLGVYPVSFASMVLGTPDRIVSMSDRAFTGVDAQTSMLFGYNSGAQAVLTCTLRAKSPTRASIVGTDARIEIDGDFYAPTDITLIPRHGEATSIESVHEGRGLRHQADQVARRLAAGELESPAMPLDETISIMETMNTVQAQARQSS